MFNTYSEALTWLYSFADFERGVGFRADTPFDQGIERTTNLLAYFNNPHTTVPTVHIAGTKGKGSVCALVANATKVSGLRTGLYTQPHLHSFRERIQIDGRPIGEEDFVDLAREINRLRGVAPRNDEWMGDDGRPVSVDLFFYRDPEEIEKAVEEQEAKRAAAYEEAQAEAQEAASRARPPIRAAGPGDGAHR